MWTDDDHDHFLRPENDEDLDKIIAPLNLYKKNDKHWKTMYSDIKKCIEMFGYMNVSLYFDEYMKYGDHIEEFLYGGFWVNLREAEYNDGSIEFENATILFENGFMLIRH